MKYLIEKENKKETEQKSIFTVLFNLDRMNSLFPGFFSIILFFYINHKEASIMDIDELNILHGKILKARLRGDEEKAKELEAKLQEATKQMNQRIDLLLLCPAIPIRIDFTYRTWRERRNKATRRRIKNRVHCSCGLQRPTTHSSDLFRIHDPPQEPLLRKTSRRTNLKLKMKRNATNNQKAYFSSSLQF